jgi:pilus assembly protein Flp/PilA
MFALVKKFRSLVSGDRRGVTALEYGLIAAVIGGVVITAATNFGSSLSTAYSTIGNALTSKAAGI